MPGTLYSYEYVVGGADEGSFISGKLYVLVEARAKIFIFLHDCVPTKKCLFIARIIEKVPKYTSQITNRPQTPNTKITFVSTHSTSTMQSSAARTSDYTASSSSSSIGSSEGSGSISSSEGSGSSSSGSSTTSGASSVVHHFRQNFELSGFGSPGEALVVNQSAFCCQESQSPKVFQISFVSEMAPKATKCRPDPGAPIDILPLLNRCFEHILFLS